MYSLIACSESIANNKVKAFGLRIPARLSCYLIAGTHGDEPESVYVQQQLTTWLLQQRIAMPLIVIPKLNPDGLLTGTRGNANGVDLNRNLPSSNWTSDFSQRRYFPGKAPASEPENQFLLSLFQQYPPGFIISFHSWKPMLNSNGDCEAVLQHLHKHNGYPIVRDQIENHPTPGSLGNYASEKLGIPVLTFETPTLDQRLDMDSIWEENKLALTSLMTSGLIEQLLG